MSYVKFEWQGIPRWSIHCFDWVFGFCVLCLYQLVGTSLDEEVGENEFTYSLELGDMPPLALATHHLSSCNLYMGGFICYVITFLSSLYVGCSKFWIISLSGHILGLVLCFWALVLPFISASFSFSFFLWCQFCWHASSIISTQNPNCFFLSSPRCRSYRWRKFCQTFCWICSKDSHWGRSKLVISFSSSC